MYGMMPAYSAVAMMLLLGSVPYYNLILSVPRGHTAPHAQCTTWSSETVALCVWPFAQLALGVGAAAVYLLFIKEAPPDGIDGAGDLKTPIF